ncbi:MAG: lipocalin family protein [Flammeovirgaceae bacterium]
MKSKFALILLSIILFSCDDDDSSAVTEGNLIGQWTIVQRMVDGSEMALGECEPFSIYTYNEDSTYNELHYAAVANSACLDNPSTEFNGTWQKNAGTSYSFTNSNNQTSEVVIEFASNNSITITSSEVTDPNGPVIQTITEKFDRIE